MAEEKKVAEELPESVGNVIELSTGVKLRGKAMPPGVFINLNVMDPPPEAPKFKMGEHIVANTDDPNFIQQMQFWEAKKNKDVLNAMIIFGTELESIPKGVDKPSSDKWIDDLELAGMKVFKDNESWRYLWWVLRVAAPESDDWVLITEVVGRLTGVPESDVDSAANFPGSS